MSEILPFNFIRFKNGKVLTSNDAGFYHLFRNNSEFNDLLNSDLTEDSLSKFKGKLFLYSNESEKASYTNLLASSLSFRYQNNLCPPSLFMIVPTLRCDHDCTYCQVSRVNESVEGFDLEADSIPKIIKIITQLSQPPYKIEFQGGEPLLRIDYIKKFLELFQKNYHHIDNEFVIATSLSKLTDEIVDWAKSRNVFFSVSLDGGKLIHDKNRRNLIGSSFGMASDGIKKIMHELGNNKVSTVTTITKDSINNPVDVVNSHINLNLHDIFIRPLSPYGFAEHKLNSYYSTKEYLLFYEKALKYIIKINKDYRLIEHFTKIHLCKIYKSKFNGYVDLKSPCGHLLGAMIFDYNGLIFGSDEARMLYKMYEVESLSLGSINDTLELSHNESLNNLLASTFISETPGCEECAYLPFCGSDPMYHLSTQLDFVGDKSISGFCQLQKGVFEIIFNLLDDDYSRSVLEGWIE